LSPFFATKPSKKVTEVVVFFFFSATPTTTWCCCLLHYNKTIEEDDSSLSPLPFCCNRTIEEDDGSLLSPSSFSQIKEGDDNSCRRLLRCNITKNKRA